jgi:hypothetical protein
VCESLASKASKLHHGKALQASEILQNMPPHFLLTNEKILERDDKMEYVTNSCGKKPGIFI